MKKANPPTRRQLLQLLGGAAALPLLSSCGTIIYPDRVNQKSHGDLDFIVVGMDAVGLLFFLIPGIIAFAVDFGTGAIYFPDNHKKGKRERTIFDQVDSQIQLDEKEIERVVAQRTGKSIDLKHDDVLTLRIDNLDQFWAAHARLSDQTMLAGR